MISRRGLAAVSAGALACLAAATLPVNPAAAGPLPSGQPDRTVVVDLDEVVQSDYLGVGVNVIPWSLTGDTPAFGYDEADWEVDVERILTIQPKVARIWFQIDWMELEKGVYDFDSPEMQAFTRYLEAFQQAGTEVELNFGWKVGERVHDWFTIPGAPDPFISAPADLEAYGHSASALLDELINTRGFDNVKYLTFYNEPNGSWDFWAPGDEKAYYADMTNAVDAQLEEDGLRDLVEIWGPEEVSAPDWTAYMEEHAGDAFDGYSFHLYGEAFDQLDEAIAARESVAGGKPVHLTEMGWTNPGTSVWETGYANYLIGSANMGVKSNLVWQMNGTMTSDPRGDTNGAFNLWDSLILGLSPTAAFYEAGPLMRYIPAHSDVLETTVSDPDVRAAAYRAADGELTVLVETQGTAEHDVRVEFTGDRVNDRFHRIAFTDSDAVLEENALLPASSGELKAKHNAFTDTLAAEHGYALYTTADPATQVAVDPVQTEVVAGEQVQLSASIIDGGPGSGRVQWSVVGEGNGTIDRQGRFTAPAVEQERTVAIRATSTRDDGAYGVAQVTVTPAHREGVADAPVFSLDPGVHASAEAVFITSTTAGATIHYTTDGSQPTAASPVYDGPIFLTGGTTQIRAIAMAEGLEPSGTTSRLYKVLGQQIAPDGYTFCGYADRSECTFEGEASVAFGSDGLFRFGTFTDGVECTAASFGGDPNPGGDNRCFVNADAPEEPPIVTIYNAGFESPATGGTANGPMVNGWTFSARAGVQHNDSVFNPASPAPEGERTAYLKSDSGLGSSLSQTVTFPAGRFAIEFWVANRADFGGLQEIDVRVDGELVGQAFPGQDGVYTLVTTEAFDVEAGQHTIEFVGTTTEGDNTAFIDAVRVVEAS